MKPVRTFSPTAYLVLFWLGVGILVLLLFIAWTTGTSEVGATIGWRLQLSMAGVVLGGGLVAYARKYKRDAEAEAALAESVRRNLEQRAPRK